MTDPVVVIRQPTTTVQISSPGPQGAPGVFNPGDVAYTHVQSVSSAVWTIDHNLGFNPTAVVLDSAGTQCEGSFSYPTVNRLIITFTAPFTGTAYVI